MNWKVVGLVIAIIVFVLLGGIGISKSALSFAKAEGVKLKTNLQDFVTKQQKPTKVEPSNLTNGDNTITVKNPDGTTSTIPIQMVN